MNCSVLVVDDEFEIRQPAIDDAHHDGIRILRSRRWPRCSGKKSLNTKPDVLILDVMMPRMDGLTLCRTLRDAEETAALPIIMLSGKAHQEAIREGLQAGADRYLVKPMGLDELTRNIHEVLRGTAVTKKRLKLNLPCRANPNQLSKFLNCP